MRKVQPKKSRRSCPVCNIPRRRSWSLPLTPPGRREVRRVDKGICQRCQVAKSIFIIRSATYCV